MQLRICGGEAGGRPLQSGKGDTTRPTPAAVREALCNILRLKLPGARVADLYAGFGTVGLEMISQGAAAALFVEQQHQAAQVLRRNVGTLGWQDRCEVWQKPVAAALAELAARGGQYDLIFADPPYDRGLAPDVLQRLAGGALLAEQATVVVQHSKREPLPDSVGRLVRVKERAAGETHLSFYELRSEA